jgi:predicted SAM-dependent methyltransferase
MALNDAAKLDLSNQVKQYHLGCGSIFLDGFLNIDGDLKRFFGNVVDDVPLLVEGRPMAAILQYDLRHGIPAAPDSLSVIYHSHFFEHLSDLEGMAFLADCNKCLSPGGLMRFALPDFGLWCENYVSNNVAFFDWYRQTYLNNDFSRFKTNASVFTAMLYNWGHRNSYDFQALSALLSAAGFVNIQRVEWGVSSKIPSMQSIEDENPRRFESLVIECVKRED